MNPTAQELRMALADLLACDEAAEHGLCDGIAYGMHACSSSLAAALVRARELIAKGNEP